MRRSNRMKRILREQSGHPYTGSGRNRPPCHATPLKAWRYPTAPFQAA